MKRKSIVRSGMVEAKSCRGCPVVSWFRIAKSRQQHRIASIGSGCVAESKAMALHRLVMCRHGEVASVGYRQC